MAGIGRAHCSISVMNPIPCGIGSSISIDLTVSVNFERGTVGKTDPVVDSCVRALLDSIGKDSFMDFALDVETSIPGWMNSECPTSIAAMNAVLDEFDSKMKEVDLCKIYSKCSLSCKSSATGSFNEACAASMKGLFVANDDTCKILHSESMEAYDAMLFYLPDSSGNDVAIEEYYRRCDDFESLSKTISKDPFNAMTENGRMISEICGSDRKMIDFAIENGAYGAGISNDRKVSFIVTENYDSNQFLKGAGCDFVKTSLLS